MVSSVALLSGGCKELEARRTIQDADKAYQDGLYKEAIGAYEDALGKADIDIGHHNLAIAAYKAFQPGVPTPANVEYGEKAAKHFMAYLKEHPDDRGIIDLLTTLWLDSEKYDEAIGYWKKELDKTPGDAKILNKLSTINRQAKRYDDALGWDQKRLESAKDNKEKFKVYRDIAQLQYSRLTKASLVDDERLEVADSGIAALQKAISFNPEANDVYGLMATLYQFRALSHFSTWGQTIDAASQSFYQKKHRQVQLASKAAVATGKPTSNNSAGQADTRPSDTKGEAQ